MLRIEENKLIVGEAYQFQHEWQKGAALCLAAAYEHFQEAEMQGPEIPYTDCTLRQAAASGWYICQIETARSIQAGGPWYTKELAIQALWREYTYMALLEPKKVEFGNGRIGFTEDYWNGAS